MFTLGALRLPGANTLQLGLPSLFVLPYSHASVRWEGAYPASEAGAPPPHGWWGRAGGWGGAPSSPMFCPLLPRRFMCDDVDFNLRVHSAGLLLCRFNRFSVMKKQIAVGGHRSFHITSKVSAPAKSAAEGSVGCRLGAGRSRVCGAAQERTALQPRADGPSVAKCPCDKHH